MYGVFIVGTAGSGKSLLTATLTEWWRMRKTSVFTVNLDPGALKLPYNPDVDARSYIDLEELMDRYELGPNGALVMATDLLADQVHRLDEELSGLNSKYIVLDTSGQMELFAFRPSGPYIAQELRMERKCLVYLFDAPFSSTPLNYVSNLFLSAAVYNRFLLPQVNVLSKVDLLPAEKVREILDWSRVPGAAEKAIGEDLKGAPYLLGRDLFRAISRLRMDFSLLATSARTWEGMVNLVGAIERALGEEGET